MNATAFDRTAARTAAFMLAALMTLGMLAGLDALAGVEGGQALMARAAALQPA